MAAIIKAVIKPTLSILSHFLPLARMAAIVMQPEVVKESAIKAININDLPNEILEEIFDHLFFTLLPPCFRTTFRSCSLTQRSWRIPAQRRYFHVLSLHRDNVEKNLNDLFLDSSKAKDTPAANPEILQYVRTLTVGSAKEDFLSNPAGDDWFHSVWFNAFVGICGARVVTLMIGTHAQIDEGGGPGLAVSQTLLKLTTLQICYCNAAVVPKLRDWVVSATTREMSHLTWQVWFNHDVDVYTLPHEE
ncbi:hypothetical protein BC835DRAFT_347283 [Cytidiella melzeri]|nr:hypothetical protein BC835DRAFT_347283 [Cytidiella melzeri]